MWHRTTRPLEDFTRGSPGHAVSADVVARCRRIARQPLDDEPTRAAIATYRTGSRAADYDDTWRRRLELIVRVIEQGDAHLPRVLSRVARLVERGRDDDLQLRDCVVMNAAVQLPHAAVGAMHRSLVARVVTGLCTGETGAVLELGSGWGEHLCHAWLSGGPRDATYFACELSEAGRKCASVLAALEPRLRLATSYFNFVAPRFDLPSGQQSAVVYSVQSVEQVEYVAADLMPRLCALARDVRGAHLEPIGWQMVPSDQWNPVTRTHARRCRKKAYNRNLWPLLKRAEAERLIVIDRAEPNVFGLAHNPVSLVLWHKR